MRVIRNRPGQVSSRHGGGPAVAIGNFDGMHLGHQALLQRCRALAGHAGAVALICFEPLPQAFFRPEGAPPRLSTIYQKLAFLRSMGVDAVWLMRFDASLARLSAVHFVEQVLADGLGARHVVVGADFRFGRGREGDMDLLQRLGGELGFEASIVAAVEVGQQRVSSTAIRSALADGDCALAARMLGRPFRMEGYVVRGRQLGRRLGYPTANIRVRALPCPLRGVFAVYARHSGGPWMPAVSSLGLRPTVGGTEWLLEVHLFDYRQDLYGQRLEVQFVAKLRDEEQFDSINQLVIQMRQDEGAARMVLQTNPINQNPA